MRILSTIDRELLKPNASVALHKHSNALVDVLPPEADSSIMMLTSGGPPPVSQGHHPCPREPGFGVQSAGQRRRWWDRRRSHSRFMGATKLGRCWCTGDQGSPELDLEGGEQQDMVRVVTRKGLMLGDVSSFTLSVVGPRVFSAGSWVLPGCGDATVLKVGALL